MNPAFRPPDHKILPHFRFHAFVASRAACSHVYSSDRIAATLRLTCGPAIRLASLVDGREAVAVDDNGGRWLVVVMVANLDLVGTGLTSASAAQETVSLPLKGLVVAATTARTGAKMAALANIDIKVMLMIMDFEKIADLLFRCRKICI